MAVVESEPESCRVHLAAEKFCRLDRNVPDAIGDQRRNLLYGNGFCSPDDYQDGFRLPGPSRRDVPGWQRPRHRRRESGSPDQSHSADCPAGADDRVEILVGLDVADRDGAD